MIHKCPICAYAVEHEDDYPFTCPCCRRLVDPLKGTVIGNPDERAQLVVPASVLNAFASGNLSFGAHNLPGQMELIFTRIPGGCSLIGCRGNVPEVEIPAEHNGLPVTSIGARAFFGRGVVSVHLPDTLIDIGCSAFEECRELTTVTGGAGLSKIAANAFRSCTGLRELRLSSCPAADITAFSGCYELGLAHESVTYV